VKIGKLLFQIVKILVIIISIGYIVLKIFHDQQRGIIFNHFKEYSFSEVLYFLLVLLLVFVNWFFEALKFKLLVKPIQQISINKSIQAVLAGITVSIFTPQRLGDFGGRIFVLETKNRMNGILATLLGSFSQLLITLIVGAILFPVYASKNNVMFSYSMNYVYLIPIAFLILLALVAGYLNLSHLGVLLSRFKIFAKHYSFIKFMQKYSKHNLFIVLLLSLLRYVVFTFQFIILLKLFSVEIDYTDALVGISQVYFLMAVIPTFALGELGVRGSLSLWILGVYTVAASGIIAASIFLWMLNLALPALVGVYFLSKLKY
jgi:hypothetical protein